MVTQDHSAVHADHRLDQMLAACLKAVEAGQPSERQTLVLRHPEIAGDLVKFFASLDEFKQLAVALRLRLHSNTDPAPAHFETVDDVAQTGISGPKDLAQTQTYQPTGRPPGPAGLAGAVEIPGYEVFGVLGRGAMGVVYQARQVRLKRLVALKMIRSGNHADEAELARFRVEAEAVARLQHPNIVQIYEIGEHQGQPFCSLEFVSGGTLAAHLAGTPQPPRRAATMARTLALAIEAAHQRGIVHRDLKPGNILLAEDGSLKITDFGQTRTGSVMGTPAYMAPEQATGLKDVGPPADVYALGSILYEMLTGQPPFKAASILETLEQVRTREPVSVRLLQPKVPRDLETVCLKCLQKEPRKRYGSADALAQDLDHWLAGKPIQARRTPAWERAYRWVLRNPVVASLAGLMAATFILGFVGVASQWRQTQAALDQAETNLYFQRISLADREAQAGNTDRAEVLLDLCQPFLRHWEWHYLKRQCHARWLRLTGHTDQVRCVAYSGDGRQLASCGNDGTVRVWDTATGKPMLTLSAHSSWVSAVVFHADGRRLVSASENGTVKIWEATEGRELHNYEYGFAHMTLSPDGRLLALLQGESLAIHDLETGRQTTKIPGRIPHNQAVAFSPDSRQVATVLDTCLHIWDALTAKELHLLQKSLSRGVYSLRFSYPNGRFLFVSCAAEGMGWTWNFEDGPTQ